jgi:dihydrodipicolinate reductase
VTRVVVAGATGRVGRTLVPALEQAAGIEVVGRVAPSLGTAVRTAELIREAGGNPHEPIHSVRLPGLVGHQEVIFGGPGPGDPARRGSRPLADDRPRSAARLIQKYGP